MYKMEMGTFNRYEKIQRDKREVERREKGINKKICKKINE